MRGACVIAYGQSAVREAGHAVESLRQHGGLPVVGIGEAVPGVDETIAWPGTGLPGRSAKVNLDHLSPFDETLYLDADARVRADVSPGFAPLGAGWDLVICPSGKQGSDWLWNLSEPERELTRGEAWPGLVLQGGLFWFGRSETTARFWEAWRSEWSNWEGPDQGALLRALQKTAMHVWLLDQQSLITHRFGMAKGR